MQEINDIAINLTRKIEADLVSAFMNKDSPHQPNFYRIRQTLLDTLQKYIEVFYVESKVSPMMLERMKPDQVEDYFRHEQERNAALMAREIFKRDDIVEKFVYEDDYSVYKSETSYLPVIKLKKLKEENER